MKLNSVHHIAIIVSNIEKAREFYIKKLGFEAIRENYRKERDDWKLDLRVDEYTELEIFAEKNPPKRVNRPCRASGYFPGSDGAVREGRGVKFIARRKAVF